MELSPSIPSDRAYQPMSTRGPALIVLGIAVFIVVVGVVASALATGTAHPGLPATVTIADGTVVHLTPAATALKSIVSGGQPPADILGNLVVPAGSPIVRTLNIDQGATQFDRTVYFTSRLSAGQVVDVFRTAPARSGLDNHLPRRRPRPGPGVPRCWPSGAAATASTGRSGVVVSPTTSAGTTPFSVEVFELPDDT